MDAGEIPSGNTGTVILRKLSFTRLWQCHKYLPPDFPANTTGAVTFAGHVLSEENISFAKSPYLATARLDLGLAFKGYHVFPAEDVVPRVMVPGRDFPEKNGLGTHRLAE